MGALLAGAVPASASFHEMSIQEVFPGSALDPGEDYVTLQMYSSGQNFVGGHKLHVYSSAGSEIGNGATFPDVQGPDVPNGASQSTILIGAASSVLGVTPDLVDADLAGIDPAGGAVCWDTVDCVSWGSFPQATVLLPPVTKTNSTIDDGLVFVRKYAERGCQTTLDAIDDTDDMDADFAIGAPVPRNNASTPTEEACPNTQITKGPEGRTTDRTPTFKFKSIPEGAPFFKCAIDSDDPNDLSGCEPPFTLPRQSLGKHQLYVAATNSLNGSDTSPALRKFKVVKKH